MKKLFLLFFIISTAAAAQQEIPRDTSFTPYSAWVKERKKFPSIEIAQPYMPKGVSSKKDIVYTTIGNRQLLLDIFYPTVKTKKGYLGVLMIFGGGWKSGDKSQNIPLAQQLAAKGYVAVTAEYRLSPEAPYPAAVYDLKAAIRWMRANASKFNLDTSKIASLGMSAGGQLAALIGTTNGLQKFEGNEGNTKFSSAVQAIVNIDGTLAFHHPESEEGKAAAEWLGGTYAQVPSIWEEAAPLNHAGKNTPPIIFINSALPRFHAGRNDMIGIISGFGIYNEVQTIPDTPHPFWLFHPWFKPVVNYTVSFLDKVFKKK